VTAHVAAAKASRTLRLERRAGLLPVASALGAIAVVAGLVGITEIGSGDYGQWLMVSRGFSGGGVPDYRSLADVPPLVPFLIGVLHRLSGDAMLALHITAFLLVAGLGAAFFAAGWALDRRPATGLIAAVLGLLVTDRYLDLLAFGGLLQAGATALTVTSFAAFMRSLREPRRERAWWSTGCLALFAACLTHLPTAMVALPVGVAAAGLAVLPNRGGSLRTRVRRAWPLAALFAVIGAYWVVVVAPASLGFVANPASLAYRGPGRVFEALASSPPTLVICVLGVASLVLWAREVLLRREPLRAPGTVLLLWALAAWAFFGLSAATGASTDYPRFVPILLAPLLVGAAGALAALGDALRRRRPRAFSAERGLAAIAVCTALVAPFSVASYETQAAGYVLPDRASLTEAALWADSRLLPGRAILAPVREGKWIEGLTGRSALFSSQVRYAFRPVEWARSLAADALFRGNLVLANENFVLTLTDGVAAPEDGITSGGQLPRTISISANHGGESVELLRLVPGSSAVLDTSGAVVASLSSLSPAGLEREATTDRLAATTHWVGVRQESPLDYSQRVELARGADTFALDVGVISDLAVGSMRLELRPPPGITIVDVAQDGALAGSADVTFGRIGGSQPRLRLAVPGGSVMSSSTGGLVISAPGNTLSVHVTDLTAGGASTSLRLLDPVALVGAYNVGAAILRHDASYEARKARLELLGFHVVERSGPYTVMMRSDAVAR
jgi:hypothetical protein